jgi:hypothetical protein
MSSKKSHREKLLKMKTVIESSIAGAKAFITGNTLAVKLPDGSLAHARDGRPVKLVYASGLTQDVEPKVVIDDHIEIDSASMFSLRDEPQATEDEPPAKHSRNARNRKWWTMDPWTRSR